MKKRFLYPIWKFDEMEKELALLEKSGWRLDKIKGLRCFEFVKSTPKTTTYFFTYYLAREKLTMHLIEDTLKQDFNANQIKGSLAVGFGGVYVFRLTKPVGLTEQKVFRNIVLQHLVFKKVVYGLLLLALELVPLTLGLILNFDKLLADMNPAYILFFVCYFLACFSYTIHNTVGYIYLRKKNNLYCRDNPR